MFWRHRCSSIGGGLCANVRDNISCSVYEANNLTSNNGVEIMWLELTFHRELLLLYVTICQDQFIW
jgi:hypothetical protein